MTPQNMLTELKKRRWTLEKIAGAIGSSPSSLSRARHDKQALAWTTYRKLCDLYEGVKNER